MDLSQRLHSLASELLKKEKEDDQNNKAQRCPSCQDKEGDLFVLPTRLSVSGFLDDGDISKWLERINKKIAKLLFEEGTTNEPWIPQLPSFAGKQVEKITLSKSKYCIQLLRAGFLYVLEVRGELKNWRTFTVSEGGFLMEHYTLESIPENPPTYGCNIATDGADASYIGFKNSSTLDKIYFVFSPNKITEDKLNYYQDEGLLSLEGITPDEIRRGQHSILPSRFAPSILEFVVATKIETQNQLKESHLNQQNTFKTFDIRERAEIERYYDNLKTSMQDIYHNNTMNHDEHILTNSKHYLSLYNKMSSLKGAAIVINDAIGITQSLNNRCNEALEREMRPWMESIKDEGISNEHRLFISNQLQDLKTNYHSYQLQKKFKQNQKSLDVITAHNQRIAHAGFGYISASMSISINDLNKATETSFTKKIANKEFKEKYWSRLSQEKLDNFEATFNAKSKAAETLCHERITDLKKWLESEYLLLALDFYDETNAHQGVFFSLQLSACLLGTSSHPDMCALLDEWWDNPVIARNNLAWRAYLFNQKKIIDKINEYNALVNMAEVPSIKPIGTVGFADSIINQTINPPLFLNYQKTLGLLEDISNHLKVTNEIIPTLGNSRLPFAMLSVNFTNLVRRFLGSSANKTLTQLSNRFYNLLLASMNKEIRVLYKMNFFSGNHKFTAQVNRAAPQILNKAKSNIKIHDFANTKIAIFAFAISASNTIYKLRNGLYSSPREQAELVASGLISASALFQIPMSLIDSTMGQGGTKNNIVVRTAFGRFYLWGAGMGFIGGSMMTVFDAMDASKERKKGNTILAIAYRVRAIAIFALSSAQLLATIGILKPWMEKLLQAGAKDFFAKLLKLGVSVARFALIPLVASVLRIVGFYVTIIILVVSVIIMIFSDNALQEWFSNCCFGKERKYKDIEEEMKALQQAMQEVF